MVGKFWVQFLTFLRLLFRVSPTRSFKMENSNETEFQSEMWKGI